MPNRDKTSGSGFGADLAPSGSTGTRKTYTAPVLQRFGQLNRVTQGSTGGTNDAGGSMSGGMGTGLGMNMVTGTGTRMGMN